MRIEVYKLRRTSDGRRGLDPSELVARVEIVGERFRISCADDERRNKISEVLTSGVRLNVDGKITELPPFSDGAIFDGLRWVLPNELGLCGVIVEPHTPVAAAPVSASQGGTNDRGGQNDKSSENQLQHEKPLFPRDAQDSTETLRKELLDAAQKKLETAEQAAKVALPRTSNPDFCHECGTQRVLNDHFCNTCGIGFEIDKLYEPHPPFEIDNLCADPQSLFNPPATLADSETRKLNESQTSVVYGPPDMSMNVYGPPSMYMNKASVQTPQRVYEPLPPPVPGGFLSMILQKLQHQIANVRSFLRRRAS